MFGTQEYVCIFPNLTSRKQGFELFWAMDLLYLIGITYVSTPGWE